ncbi:MAG: ABC transporter ATP-binding protein, partial [Candidatus Rifleibacteriota bacterium]
KMEPILEVKELTKTFGKVTVLNKLSLSVQPGEIFGVLGLNGIGKTTLFKCILGLLKKDEGEIFYKGSPLEIKQVHSKIGYLPEFYLPPGELTAYEYLRLLSMSIGGKKPDIDALLKKTNLAAEKPISNYSRGMIQRLGLIISQLKSPEFLILDEPTLGLDPLSRQNLLDWLLELNEQGQTILLSSHDFSQLEKVCKRVAILHDHKIIYCDDVKEFKRSHSTDSLEQAFLKEIGGHSCEE